MEKKQNIPLFFWERGIAKITVYWYDRSEKKEKPLSQVGFAS